MAAIRKVIRSWCRLSVGACQKKWRRPWRFWAAYITGQAISIDGGWTATLTSEPASAAASSELSNEILEAVRSFLQREVRPYVANLERNAAYPERLVELMKELGMFGMLVPAQYGGLELPHPLFAQVMEEVAAGWTTLAAYLNSHSTVVYWMGKFGTPEQKERYLPALARGAEQGALCLTEPGAGSDLQAIQTVARSGEHGLSVRGNKIYVTNGARASLYAVLVKTDPKAKPPKAGISLLLVEQKHSGVSIAGTFHKMAYGLVDTVEVIFDDVLVPASSVLGAEPDKGCPSCSTDLK